MSQRSKQAPSNWTAYESGRTASVGSLNSIVEDESQPDDQHDATFSLPDHPPFRGIGSAADGEQNLRARRSSVFNSLRQIGGVNNLDNFARSFQRAAGFRTITPVRRGSISYTDDGEGGEEETFATTPSTERSLPNRSLLRQQFEAARQTNPEMAVTESPSTQHAPGQPEPSERTTLLRVRSRTGEASISTGSRLLSDTGPDLGTSYGSISSRLTNVAQRRASILIQQHIEASLKAREQQEEGEEYKDDPLERPVDVETREDGEVIERIIGESTVPMTVFNSINVLIGVGILALPLAVRYSGWVIGMLLLLLPAVLTNYTARILAKCLDTNSGSTTYGDLAFLAFGDTGRAIVEAIFVVELLGSVVALLILFGDTMQSLMPSVGNLLWKTILTFALIPLNFVPFKALSVTSILGIFCTMTIVILVLTDGFIKPQAPGSLRQISKTYPFPEDWRTVPLSIGLFVSPWGGHSVFPAVYKDMRHPQKYTKALTSTYIFTYGLDLTMAVFGYLMFGDLVRDEITKNVIADAAYPKVISIMIVVLIAVIPITKIPLSTRPIMDTINKKMLIDLRQMDAKARKYSQKSWKHRSGRGAVAVLTNVLALGMSILIPEFDSIMATLGASVCLAICVIFPLAFYLKIFSSEGQEISKRERTLDWVLIVIAVVFAIAGTVAGILPKEKLGVKACQGIACLG